MDLREYSIDEFENMQESLIGSLVSFCHGYDAELSGRGLLINLRRERGEVYARIAWTVSPFIRYTEIRKIGWHSINRLFILQNKHGVRKYVYQSSPLEGKY